MPVKKATEKSELEKAAEAAGGLTNVQEEGPYGDDDQVTPVTPNDIVPVVDPSQTWGPFAEPTHVTTPHGEFGVPRGNIMHLEPHKVWNVKNQEWRDTWKPVFQKVRIDHPKREPSTPEYRDYREDLARRREAGEFRAS